MKTSEGSRLIGNLLDIGNRKPQNVSGDKNRCWVRSAWGTAVDSLSSVQFNARVRFLAESLKDHELLKNNGLTIAEIDKIYNQIKENPFYGMQNVNEALENKQRALMMAVVDTTKSLVSNDTRETLAALIAGDNEQAEQDFGVLFLNALDLPVVLDRDQNSAPIIFLPEELTISELGHPSTWATLYYRGTGERGHYQFYPKMNKEAERVGA